jgi:hypothetical protein
MPTRRSAAPEAPAVPTRRSGRNIRAPVPADVPVSYVIPGRLEDEEISSSSEEMESLHGISPQASPVATAAGDSDVEILEMPPHRSYPPTSEMPRARGATPTFEWGLPLGALEMIRVCLRPHSIEAPGMSYVAQVNHHIAEIHRLQGTTPLPEAPASLQLALVPDDAPANRAPLSDADADG